VFSNLAIQPPASDAPFPVTPFSLPNVAFSSFQTSEDPGRFGVVNGTSQTFALKSFYLYSGRSKTDTVEVFVLGYKPGSEDAVQEAPKTLSASPSGIMGMITLGATYSGLRQVVVRVEEEGRRVAYALDDVTVQWSC
jgi:hypothetical protein